MVQKMCPQKVQVKAEFTMKPALNIVTIRGTLVSVKPTPSAVKKRAMTEVKTSPCSGGE